MTCIIAATTLYLFAYEGAALCRQPGGVTSHRSRTYVGSNTPVAVIGTRVRRISSDTKNRHTTFMAGPKSIMYSGGGPLRFMTR